MCRQRLRLAVQPRSRRPATFAPPGAALQAAALPPAVHRPQVHCSLQASFEVHDVMWGANQQQRCWVSEAEYALPSASSADR
jgi:hypothetical protein